MAEKVSRVRLELASAGFLSMMRELEKQAKGLADEIEDIGEAGDKADKKLHPALQSMKKGFGAAKDSLADMGRTLKTTLAQAATLGGALGIGAAVKSATELTQRYRDIAFAVELASGKAVDWRNVQKSIEETADATKLRLGPLTDAFQALAAQGGMQFAQEQIGLIGEVARATGDDVKALGGIGAALVEKFGLTGEEFKQGFGAAIKSAKEAGISTEELSSRVDALAAVGSAAGFKGGEGFAKLSSLLATTNAQTKNVGASTMGLEQIFERVSNKEFLKQFEKATGVKLKIDVNEGDAADRMRKLLSAGPKALLKFEEGVVDKNQRAAFEALVGPFKEAFQAARATGEDVKTATKKGLDAYDKALEEAGKKSLDYAAVQRQAADNAKSPQAQLDAAINNFTKAFQRPEAVDAINRIAAVMPKFADMLASLVEFGTKHPLLAGGAFLGAKAGGAFLGSVGGDLAGGLAKKIAGSLTGIGKSVGAELAASAAKHSAWGAAGTTLAKIGGPLIAAAIAFEIGKAAIDKHFEQKEADQRSLVEGQMEVQNALTSGDPATQRAAADSLRQRIAGARKRQSGISGFIDETLGGAAELFTGGDVKHDVQANVIAKAEAELRELEKAMEKGAKGGDKAGTALDRTAASAERAAQAFDRIAASFGGGGDGTNGLPGTPGNKPGSWPGT